MPAYILCASTSSAATPDRLQEEAQTPQNALRRCDLKSSRQRVRYDPMGYRRHVTEGVTRRTVMYVGGGAKPDEPGQRASMRQCVAELLRVTLKTLCTSSSPSHISQPCSGEERWRQKRASVVVGVPGGWGLHVTLCTCRIQRSRGIHSRPAAMGLPRVMSAAGLTFLLASSTSARARSGLRHFDSVSVHSHRKPSITTSMVSSQLLGGRCTIRPSRLQWPLPNTRHVRW